MQLNVDNEPLTMVVALLGVESVERSQVWLEKARANSKTSVMFHAKDDVPEVRQAVFKLLREADLRFYAVVRDESALENARAEFQRSFRFSMPGRFEIDCSKPAERAGPQAVDYCLWAPQRHYEKGESRYLEYLWPQVGEIHSLDEIAEGRVGVLYGQRRPTAWDTGEQA